MCPVFLFKVEREKIPKMSTFNVLRVSYLTAESMRMKRDSLLILLIQPTV